MTIGIIIAISIVIIMSLFMFFSYKSLKEFDKQNKITIEENSELRKEKEKLINEYNKYHQEKENAEKDLHEVQLDLARAVGLIDARQAEYKRENEKLKDLRQDIKNAYKDKEEMSQKAYENFCDILDRDYEVKSNDYDKLISALKASYINEQDKLLKELNNLVAEIENMKQTRAAAIEAQVREKEIKADMSFYCLIPSKNDLQDYDKINSLRPMLNNGRALSMLLWQTYYQPLAKKQFPQILGTSTTVIGIYKITNQITNECYIGQSLNIDTRWKDHCKAGLGIDTPANNKLYKAIQEYGLYNFSFEVLEKCEKEQLDEKEKFYIELYDAYNFGYNATKGNKGVK